MTTEANEEDTLYIKLIWDIPQANIKNKNTKEFLDDLLQEQMEQA